MARGKKMMRPMNECRDEQCACFTWRAFGRALVVSFIDCGGAAIVVAALWCFVRYGIFDGERIPTTADDVAKIVRAVAWPSLSLLVVLLFRNPLLRILNEMPTFVRRSFYRNGTPLQALDPGEKSKKLSDDKESDDKKANDSSMPLPSKRAGREELSVENKVGRELAERYGGRYFLDKCIGSRRYIFDVVIETPTKLYGVEIKRSSNADAWDSVLDRIEQLYEDWPDTVRERFTFIPIVRDASVKKEVVRKAKEYEFKTKVKRIGYE